MRRRFRLRLPGRPLGLLRRFAGAWFTEFGRVNRAVEIAIARRQADQVCPPAAPLIVAYDPADHPGAQRVERLDGGNVEGERPRRSAIDAEQPEEVFETVRRARLSRRRPRSVQDDRRVPRLSETVPIPSSRPLQEPAISPPRREPTVWLATDRPRHIEVAQALGLTCNQIASPCVDEPPLVDRRLQTLRRWNQIHRAPGRGRRRAIGRQYRRLLRHRSRRNDQWPLQGRGHPPTRTFAIIRVPSCSRRTLALTTSSKAERVCLILTGGHLRRQRCHRSGSRRTIRTRRTGREATRRL